MLQQKRTGWFSFINGQNHSDLGSNGQQVQAKKKKKNYLQLYVTRQFNKRLKHSTPLWHYCRSTMLNSTGKKCCIHHVHSLINSGSWGESYVLESCCFLALNEKIHVEICHLLLYTILRNVCGGGRCCHWLLCVCLDYRWIKWYREYRKTFKYVYFERYSYKKNILERNKILFSM